MVANFLDSRKLLLIALGTKGSERCWPLPGYSFHLEISKICFISKLLKMDKEVVP